MRGRCLIPGAAPLLRTWAPAIKFNLCYPGQFFDQESGLHYNYFRSDQSGTGATPGPMRAFTGSGLMTAWQSATRVPPALRRANS